MSENETTRPPLALPPGVDRVSDLGTLLTLKETAERLGVSVKTVRRMVTRGDFAGAHQAPMPTGKGSQWMIPYASVLPHENERTQVQATAPATATARELEELRAQVTRLESDLALSRALADERRQQLDALHKTFQLALTAGKEEPTRRKWWRKS